MAPPANQLEFIHPFADGNGRMGRLWQTLILSEWRSELAWLPVETLIHDQQQDYYRILGICDRASDGTVFIDFMLEKLVTALAEGIGGQKEKLATMSEETSEESLLPLSRTAERILTIIAANPSVTIAQLAETLAMSSRTIERSLKVLQEGKRLIRVGATKNGYWQVV